MEAQPFSIGGIQVGGQGARTFVIAELSANHVGKYEVAVRSIEAMAAAGADAVKLQTFTPDSMTLDSEEPMFKARAGTLWAGRKLYDLYREGALPYAWHAGLKRVAEEHGLICFSTPFDLNAADFLEDLGVQAYKIASPEITDVPLIRHVACKGQPVILSTGMADYADIDLAVSTCRAAGNNQIAVLHCTSAYPTPLEAVDLASIPHLRETFGVVPGLSDHTLSTTVPVAAVALGASVLEKHFILDRSLGGPDALFSLDPDQFRAMVAAIRDTERAIGEVRHRLSGDLRQVRESARSLFVVQDVQAGGRLTGENVRSLRPNYGLHPRHYDDVIGRRAAVDLKRGTPLKWQHVETEECAV